VTEYGATNLSTGRLTITATPSNPGVFKFNTVADVPPRNAYAAPANFDRTHAYTWVVFRPGTAAGFAQSGGTVGAANQDDFTTQNTVAQIAITDAATGTVYSVATGNLTGAVLNQYLRFDPTAGTPAGALGFVDPATGSALLPSVGTFSFVLGPDTLGNPGRVISLTYTPVPEPAAVLVVAAAGLAGLCLVRRRMAGVCSCGAVGEPRTDLHVPWRSPDVPQSQIALTPAAGGGDQGQYRPADRVRQGRPRGDENGQVGVGRGWCAGFCAALSETCVFPGRFVGSSNPSRSPPWRY
jgi:hypothetical protein